MKISKHGHTFPPLSKCRYILYKSNISLVGFFFTKIIYIKKNYLFSFFYDKVLTFINVLENPESLCIKIISFLKSFIVIGVIHLKRILTFDLIKSKITDPKIINVCAMIWLNWPSDLRCHKRMSPKIKVKKWLRQSNFRILFITWTP